MGEEDDEGEAGDEGEVEVGDMEVEEGAEEGGMGWVGRCLSSVENCSVNWFGRSCRCHGR